MRVLIVEGFGLHHYVAHLADSISRYCRVDILGYSRTYIPKIPFHFILPEDFLSDNARLSTLQLIFMSLLYTPLKLSFLLRKGKYEVIHVQGHVPWFFLLFPYIHKKRIAMVWTIHDPVYRPSHTGVRGLLEMLYIRLSCLPRLSMKHSDFVIVHGKKLSRLLETWGVESRKIGVLPHGNFSLLRRIGKTVAEESLRDYVLFFGKIKPYKGIETIIRAVPVMKREIENVLVVVAGFGDMHEYFSLVNEEDTENFRFLNHHIADKEIPCLFQNAAVVVLPYTAASQSGVLSLAYTFGKPVVVSNVGSMDEYVDAESTGFIFEPNDYRSLAEIIVKFLGNRKLRKEMELNCYKKAISDLSWDKIARQTHEMYKTAHSSIS